MPRIFVTQVFQPAFTGLPIPRSKIPTYADFWMPLSTYFKLDSNDPQQVTPKTLP
jgi:hypothetical protein